MFILINKRRLLFRQSRIAQFPTHLVAHDRRFAVPIWSLGSIEQPFGHAMPGDGRQPRDALTVAGVLFDLFGRAIHEPARSSHGKGQLAAADKVIEVLVVIDDVVHGRVLEKGAEDPW